MLKIILKFFAELFNHSYYCEELDNYYSYN